MQIDSIKTKLNDLPIGAAFKNHPGNNSYNVITARNRKNRTVLKIYQDDGKVIMTHSLSKFVSDNTDVYRVTLPESR